MILEEVVDLSQDERLAELVLYVANRTRDDPMNGATKLNKYLYFADVAAIRRLGRPITDAEYQKLPHGPAPRRLPPVRARLVRDGDAKLEQRVDALGYVHHDLVPEREARTDLFTDEELRVVDEVIDTLRPLTAAQVSRLSHDEAGWQLVEEGETIPSELAFVLAPARAVPTPAVRAEGERLMNEYRDKLA